MKGREDIRQMDKHDKHFEVFANLPSDEGLRFSSIAVSHEYKANETIYFQEDAPEKMYLVASGRVKIVRLTSEGYESILCVRSPGEYFCPVPVLDGGTQLGSAIAMTDVTLLEVDRSRFLDFCETCPSLMDTVQRDCLSEVRFLIKRMESFAYRGVRERLAITLLAELRKKAADEDPSPMLHLTHQEIASLIGASRESVSRHFSALAKEGIVKLGRGRVRILDRARLEKLAAE